MLKHPLTHVEGVSNIELFYDLIFVYCISVLTSLCHHVEGSFLDLGTWLIFLFSYLAVLQVWFFTTLLMNRFGEQSATDNLCLFVNMFLLYFMASGIQSDWASSAHVFNLSWALILANQALHWELKRQTISNLDASDLRMIDHTVITLVAQALIALAASFLPFRLSVAASWIAMLLGCTVWGWSSAYKAKSSRFAHIAERCALLTIVAFGEMVVTLSTYIGNTSSLVYPIFVFALMVGLFLIYIFEHDNMLDHHHPTHGMGYMTISAWLIICLGNLTVALEYMTMREVATMPKSIFLNGCLVAYLLSSFAIAHYNKPEFSVSPAYAAGRLVACAAMIAAAWGSGFNPLVMLLTDTTAVYGALWHEWHIYHARIGIRPFSGSFVITNDEEQDIHRA